MAKPSKEEEFEELETNDEEDDELEDETEENDDEEDDDEEESEDESDEDDEEEDEKPKPQQSKSVFTKEDVSRMVQRRINSKNAKIKTLQEDSDLIEELCELAGMSKSDLRTRLQAMPIETRAKLMGLSVNEVQTKSMMSKQMRELKKMERETKLKEAETALKKNKQFADFDDIKDEVYDILETYPSMSLQDAYAFVKATGDGLTNMTRQIEQRVLEKKAAQSKKKVVKPSGGVVDKKKSLSSEEKMVAEKMGLTEAEYISFQRVSSIDEMPRKKKKKG
jgi:hypothetical protein